MPDNTTPSSEEKIRTALSLVPKETLPVEILSGELRSYLEGYLEALEQLKIAKGAIRRINDVVKTSFVTPILEKALSQITAVSLP